jgi:hypothetical protein
MSEDQKKKVAEKILSRASTGLYFLEDFLYDRNARDIAWIRSLCIILSYSFELLLKANVVVAFEYGSQEEIDTELRDLNHDILKISKKLGPDKLGEIGIQSIMSRDTKDFLGYIIKTENKEIEIENFNNIRYDFFNNSNRDLYDEGKFEEWTQESLKILGATKLSVYGAR